MLRNVEEGPEEDGRDPPDHESDGRGLERVLAHPAHGQRAACDRRDDHDHRARRVRVEGEDGRDDDAGREERRDDHRQNVLACSRPRLTLGRRLDVL